MKITHEINSLYEFEAWSGAKWTKEKLMAQGIDEEFIAYCEDIFPDGCTDTELNDFLWFESDMIFNAFGLDENGDPIEEEEEEEEE